MTYAISGLDSDLFVALLQLDDEALAAHGARRVLATSDRGYPCRITLEDARKGEELFLLHWVTHPVTGPYRFAFAIYVRAAALNAGARARYIDCEPPVFAGRTLALRGFAADGALIAAELAPPGETDEVIRKLFATPQVAYIHAHNAAHGCFAALIEREGSPS